MWLLALFLALSPRTVQASEFRVYGLYRALNMGADGENPPKDYYVNMGTQNGVSQGSVLEVLRRMSTYDVENQQVYQDMSYPIARIKIIHVEKDVAVARLKEMLPRNKTPISDPHTVMVGDSVRPVASRP
jgi:hypothetical protein